MGVVGGKRSAEHSRENLSGVVEEFWRRLNYIPSSGRRAQKRGWASTVKPGVRVAVTVNGYFGRETSDLIVLMLTDCCRKPDYFAPFREEMRNLEA